MVFRKKAFAFLFLIILFFILVFTPRAKGAAKIFFMQTAKVPLQAANSITKVPQSLPKSRSAKENILLKEKIGQLNAEIFQLKEIKKENQRLRDLLNFKKQRSYQTIAAAVIGRDSSIWSETAIIDKGRKDGIEPNMAVVTDLGVVGRVTEVGPTVSRVLLITDPNSRLGVVLQEARELGIAEGTLRSIIKIRYIDINADVKVNDVVVTSGFGKNFPKGVLVGKVFKVELDRSRLYKYAYVKPAVDLGRIEEVLCIK